MQIYSKYIARQLVHATLLITISLTSIVWLMQALRYIDFIVSQGVSIALFLKLTLLLVPSLVMMILPPAYFCAVIFTYNKLKVDSELVVMQAMGLTKWKLTQPALRVGLGLVAIGYAIALYLQPLSVGAFYAARVISAEPVPRLLPRPVRVRRLAPPDPAERIAGLAADEGDHLPVRQKA